MSMNDSGPLVYTGTETPRAQGAELIADAAAGLERQAGLVDFRGWSMESWMVPDTVQLMVEVAGSPRAPALK